MRGGRRSVAAVEEESDTADDVAVSRAVAGHLERAEELLSVQVEVERRLHDGLLGVRVRLALLDPGQGGHGKLDDFGCFAPDLVHLGTIEGTTLKEQSLDKDGSISIDLSLLEGRDQLELVDGHVVHSGGLLTERVQECLRVEQVRDADRLIAKTLWH